jgi:hypothetical protein
VDDGVEMHLIGEDTEEGELLKWVEYEGGLGVIAEWLPVMFREAGEQPTLGFSGLYSALGIA